MFLDTTRARNYYDSVLDDLRARGLAHERVYLERLRLDDILSPTGASLPFSSFCNSSTARLRYGMPRISARNSSERIDISGFSRPAQLDSTYRAHHPRRRAQCCRRRLRSWTEP